VASDLEVCFASITLTIEAQLLVSPLAELFCSVALGPGCSPPPQKRSREGPLLLEECVSLYGGLAVLLAGLRHLGSLEVPGVSLGVIALALVVYRLAFWLPILLHLAALAALAWSHFYQSLQRSDIDTMAGEHAVTEAQQGGEWLLRAVRSTPAGVRQTVERAARSASIIQRSFTTYKGICQAQPEVAAAVLIASCVLCYVLGGLLYTCLLIMLMPAYARHRVESVLRGIHHFRNDSFFAHARAQAAAKATPDGEVTTPDGKDGKALQKEGDYMEDPNALLAEKVLPHEKLLPGEMLLSSTAISQLTPRSSVT